jgi:preprotein translocase subunit SecF
MAKKNRKKIVMFSMVLIIIVLLSAIAYSFIASNYILERTSGAKIEFSTRRRDDSDTYANEEYLLFTDMDDWRDFLNRTFHTEYYEYYNESEKNSLITTHSILLNFTDFVYFGAFWGFKPSGGYAIEIMDLILNDNELTVIIQRIRPDEIASSETTAPYHLISIEQNEIPENVRINIKFINENNSAPLLMIGVIFFSSLLMIIDLKEKRGKEPKDED